MANKRELKKDIDYLVYEVVSDCFTVMSVKPEGDRGDKLSGVIADAIKLRNDLFARVNHPDGKDNPSLVKKHFTSIRVDLIKGIDSLFERVSDIAKA
jgi:hypothetical protein